MCKFERGRNVIQQVGARSFSKGMASRRNKGRRYAIMTGSTKSWRSYGRLTFHHHGMSWNLMAKPLITISVRAYNRSRAFAMSRLGDRAACMVAVEEIVMSHQEVGDGGPER